MLNILFAIKKTHLTTLFCLLALSAFSLAELPANLDWQTNTTAPEWSAEEAAKGGMIRLSIPSFPPTLRTVGPDANNAFRSFLLDNQMPLVAMHPNTGEVIPMLASHWAYDADGKTVHYRLKKNARWSDGKAVTADDFLFALEFNRSQHIVAPWYNKHYQEEITDIVKHNDHTFSIKGARKKPQKEIGRASCRERV